MIERYSRPEMAALWTLESRFKAWLEVELAVCEAWTRLGVVPQADMETIRAKAGFDVDRILEIEEKTRHDVIAFLTAVEEKVGPSARFIHLGCTSSDIVDTANAVLLVRAGKLILADIDKVLSVLKDMAYAPQGPAVHGPHPRHPRRTHQLRPQDGRLLRRVRQAQGALRQRAGEHPRGQDFRRRGHLRAPLPGA
jgi:adenylosuccinate lyase